MEDESLDTIAFFVKTRRDSQEESAAAGRDLSFEFQQALHGRKRLDHTTVGDLERRTQ